MRLVTEREASEVLSCTVAALRKWRRERRGPAWIKLGRLVRYEEHALAEFIERHTVGTPAAPGLAHIFPLTKRTS